MTGDRKAGRSRGIPILAVALAALAGGARAYGAAHGVLQRMWTDLLARPSGPLAFRFLLQPAMAAGLAIRDGFEDARTGRSPYFWTVFTRPDERRGRLREGLTATARIIPLGLVVDAIYQFRVLGAFNPSEALATAIVLAFFPYLLIRGPAERIARRWAGRALSGRPQ